MPDSINNNIMYYFGRSLITTQRYIGTTFTASQVEERIFIGDVASASNKEAMHDQGITHIITVINGGYELFPNDFIYKIIHVNDDTWVDIGEYFDSTVCFINQVMSDPKNKIMIHCHQGVSRSVAVYMAYKLYCMNNINHINFSDIDNMINSILHDIRIYRKIANPNNGFIQLLKQYVCKLNNYKI